MKKKKKRKPLSQLKQFENHLKELEKLKKQKESNSILTKPDADSIALINLLNEEIEKAKYNIDLCQKELEIKS